MTPTWTQMETRQGDIYDISILHTYLQGILIFKKIMRKRVRINEF